ncbi:cold-shock protein [Aspergillus mulundensis]|uniref:Cold shock NA binding protein (JCVI) n=1 Tax=Aspergillus mulundensis TaxID=1810919 RepID=A0A3D8SWN5_9EURO|nr:Cold shock NA binding protein (JCVI) [Aspergillus mulundensis]RDW90732.1 Cold shock NA binding protein (JCVI) [Aspergillus mulundensis]
MSNPSTFVSLPLHTKSSSTTSSTSTLAHAQPNPQTQTKMPAAVNSTANRQTGTIKWYNDAQGFGYITSDFGGELILRRQSITEHTQQLKSGMKVSYEAVHLPMLLMAEQVQPEEE